MLATLLLAGLSSCGAGRPALVRIGPNALEQRALSSLLKDLAPNHEALVPPGFAACVARRRALAIGADQGALRVECTHQYRQGRRAALEFFIAARWIIGEAARRGLDAASGATRARASERRGEIAAATGGKGTNAELEAHAELDAARIHRAWLDAAPEPTATEVLAFYRQHPSRYEHLERRRIVIAENLSAGGAARLKRDVQAGRRTLNGVSLREVVERLHPSSHNTTRAAMRAIFAARSHVLAGPIKLNERYAIFEVTAVIPASHDPFARVKGGIRAQLRREQLHRYLARELGAWERRWRRLTTCAAGSRVPGCREYAGRAALADPFAGPA